ncbi:MAG: methyltransferase domain-containing protein [Peptococcaceae bacterium]|nr:methyltransferase domain-containing protein [Peptococcaceae bacterium]
MDTGEICRLYENSSLRRVAGGVLRPGGFDLTDRAVDFCGFRPGSRVLDLGCGTGATVAHLVDKYNLRAAGIDPSAALLACGRKSRPDLPLIQAAAENLPFLPGRMDGIFAECTLSVVNNPDGALKECYRVLRDGGWLVITDIYAGNPEAAEELRTLPLASCITGAMTRHDLDYKLNNAGFSTVLWEDHAHLLKDLVIKIIMSHGSMQNFWRQAGPDDIDAGRVQEVVKKARPGYFLLIARKSGALL